MKLDPLDTAAALVMEARGLAYRNKGKARRLAQHAIALLLADPALRGVQESDDLEDDARALVEACAWEKAHGADFD